MARPRKTQKTIEDAAREADEAIQKRAEELAGADNDAPEDDLAPVDDNEPAPEPSDDGLDGYDLSNIDDGTPQPQNNDSEIQHKYDVLQGKYNAETKRLSDMLATAMAEIETLKVQIATNKPDASHEPSDNADIDTLKEEYPALYKSFLALARQEIKSEIGNAIKGTESKVNDILKSTEIDKRNTYYTSLSRLVPGYEQINSHPVFLKWLDEPVNDLSPAKRREFLTAAFNNYDPEGTAKFFNAFIKEKGIRPRAKTTVSDQIAPDTSGNVTRVNQAQQQSGWTRAKISKFYQDKQAGLLNGTEAEIAKTEASIFQAVREGKVKG